MKKLLALGSLSILVFALLLAGCGPRETPTEGGQPVDEQPVSETSVTDVSPLIEEEGQRSEASQEMSQLGGSVIDWSKPFPGTEGSPEEERVEESAKPSLVAEAGTTQEIEEKSAETQQLVDSLEQLKTAIVEKIDSDVEVVSVAFTDVKDYWRAKRWADIFRVPLRLIEGTLSVLSTAYDLLTLSASSQIAIGAAESTSQILSVFATINGAWEAGEKLQLALDGPSYTAAIDEMLEDADASTVPPFGFDRGYYRRTILNHLWGVDGQSPLVIVERASSVQREGLSVVSGALAVRSKIQKSIDLLVAEIEQQGIPDDFPLEECVAQLEDLTSQIVLSKSRSIESIDYDVYLAAGNSYSRHELSTSLGSIGALYDVFGHLAGILDEVLKIETTTEVVKVATAAGNAALFYSGTYSIKGLAEGIKVFTRVAAPIAIVVDLHKVLEYGNPEEAYYSIPQEMMLALPVELSNLWVLTGDVESYIRYLAGIPLEQDVPVGESPCIVEVHPGESIQEAIDQAPKGAVICLVPGIYVENLLIRKDLTLRGQGETQEETHIIGTIQNRPVIEIVGDKEIEVVMRNLTVAKGVGNEGLGERGILIYGKSKVFLISMLLRENMKGLYVAGKEAQVTIQNTIISDNTWVGLVIMDSEVSIQSSTISNNRTWGIRVGEAAQVTIQNSTIFNNRDALGADGSAQISLQNCTLRDSKDGSGVGIAGSARVTVEGCTISNNAWRGFDAIESGKLFIENSTVSNNRDGGIRVWNTVQVTLQNCVISSNQNHGVSLCSEAVARIENCEILNNVGYGIEASGLTGRVIGCSNTIRERKEPDGNREGALLPAYPGEPWPEGFLVGTSEDTSSITPPTEPILVLDQLTRGSVAEFLSQHPVVGKAWVRFERERGVSKDEIYAAASALKEQGYIQDYLRSPFGSRFAITWTTREGSNYLREPDMEEISESYRGMCRDFDGFVYEQNIMVALYEKDDIRVTGIQQDGSYARVEYTWKRGRTTPIFDILHPVISSNMVEEFSAGERYDYEAYFSLYDDGWRVEICY